jgi:hypothetical protein
MPTDLPRTCGGVNRRPVPARFRIATGIDQISVPRSAGQKAFPASVKLKPDKELPA